MRRRTFLHGVVVSALAANHARIWAQSTTPSLLGEGKPSRTAQVTANLRAAHQLLDQPKIFDDPLALRIIGVQAEAAVRANLGRSPIATFRPFVAVRSRYAEDELARAVERGVRQYVVLGGGLDTFAYRNPYPVSPPARVRGGPSGHSGLEARSPPGRRHRHPRITQVRRHRLRDADTRGRSATGRL
jgi:hypothetical protein